MTVHPHQIIDHVPPQILRSELNRRSGRPFLRCLTPEHQRLQAEVMVVPSAVLRDSIWAKQCRTDVPDGLLGECSCGAPHRAETEAGQTGSQTRDTGRNEVGS